MNTLLKVCWFHPWPQGAPCLELYRRVSEMTGGIFSDALVISRGAAMPITLHYNPSASNAKDTRRKSKPQKYKLSVSSNC